MNRMRTAKEQLQDINMRIGMKHAELDDLEAQAAALDRSLRRDGKLIAHVVHTAHKTFDVVDATSGGLTVGDWVYYPYVHFNGSQWAVVVGLGIWQPHYDGALSVVTDQELRPPPRQ